jgi:hypothetical protein
MFSITSRIEHPLPAAHGPIPFINTLNPKNFPCSATDS